MQHLHAAGECIDLEYDDINTAIYIAIESANYIYIKSGEYVDMRYIDIIHIYIIYINIKASNCTDIKAGKCVDDKGDCWARQGKQSDLWRLVPPKARGNQTNIIY